MSLDSFIGMEAGEPMSAASLEKLKEKMARAQAQIAAIQREEKKHKKKEQDLLKILLKFVKTSHKSTLVLLISRVLEQNVPANFVLSVIILGNEEIQEQLKDFLMLKGAVSDEKALTFFGKDESLPLKLKIELDNWVKGMLLQAEVKPQKLLDTAYKIDYIKIEDEDSIFGEKKFREEKYIQPPLIKLAAHVAGDYLKQNGQTEDHQRLEEFAEFILNGILTKTKENLDNRGILEGDVEEEI